MTKTVIRRSTSVPGRPSMVEASNAETCLAKMCSSEVLVSSKQKQSKLPFRNLEQNGRTSVSSSHSQPTLRNHGVHPEKATGRSAAG